MDGLILLGNRQETKWPIYNLGNPWNHLDINTLAREIRWIGNPQRGCVFCGEVAVKVGIHNDAKIYHPAVECCEKAINKQIEYRSAELATTEKAVENHVEEIARLEETVQAYGNSRSANAAEAQLKLDKANRGVKIQLGALRDTVEEQRDEIARLTRLLAQKRRAA